MRFTCRTHIVATLLLCLLSAGAAAQSFPSKPLRLALRSPPGGADDLQARLIAPQLSQVLGQQVIIDYRPGAGGLVAWEYVAKSPPDGYAPLLTASGLASVKSLRANISIDPWRLAKKDAAKVDQIVRAANIKAE